MVTIVPDREPIMSIQWVTRAQWDAARSSGVENRPGSVHYGIAVHYSAAVVGNDPHSTCASKVRSMQRYHQQTKGWADIAYSYLICPHGYVFTGRGMTAGPAAQGTTAGNLTYWAVCFLAGPTDLLSKPARAAFWELRTYLMQRKCGRLVRPHSDFTSTLCPGRIISSWLRLTSPEL